MDSKKRTINPKSNNTMRDKIEQKIIKLADQNHGLVFGIFSALVILSIFGAILGLLILGGYV